MRIGFIGCVESSHRVLESLLRVDEKDIEVVAVITKAESSVNSDFVNLAPLCEKYNIPYHYEINSNRAASTAFLKQHKVDIIYCIGWSYLLGEELLNLAPLGSIGFHPAPLPMGRGRHPLIWSLVLGLEETAVSFFRMDAGADSGPIVSQTLLPISHQDSASTLYEKVLAIAEQEIVKISFDIAKGKANFNIQDQSKATYWRKRSRKDGIIDFRMGALDIYNLIRALTKPYPGAEFYFEGVPVSVWSAALSESDYSTFIEPGRILEIKNTDVLVKCSGGDAIWLHNIEIASRLKVGDFL